MKNIVRMTRLLAVNLILCTPVWAAAGAREDSSNMLVWAFLGICGLIIFLQMVPVISLTYGLIKGVTGGKKQVLDDDLEAVVSKYR